MLVPAVAHLPESSRRRRRRIRLAGAHRDVACDRAAIRRRVVERQRRVPGARGRLGDLGEPGIRRPAVPVGRFGRDASIGRDQRKHALERLFGDDHDAQRRALPRRDRRGQDRELRRVGAAARRRFGRRIHCRRKRTKLSRQQQTGLREAFLQPSWRNPEPPSALPAGPDCRITELADINQQI